MLTDAQCKAAKPTGKAYKLADSRGLYLFVTPTGFRSWRWKYRVAGREKTLTLGSYPEVKLTAARDARDEARKAHKAGLDPSQTRQKEREARVIAEATTFETIATQWHTRNLPRWTKDHGAFVLRFLKASAFPKLGAKPLKAITSPMVLEVLTPVEQRSIERGHRLRG